MKTFLDFVCINHENKIHLSKHLCKANMEKLDLKEVGKILPNGAIKEIAEHSGVKYADTSRMFKGLETRRTPEVREATLNYLRQLRPIVEKVFSQL